MSSEMPHLAADTHAGDTDRLGRGVWAGIAPLLLLILIVGLAFLGAALARLLTGSSDFLTWRWITLGIWGGGLVVAVALYCITTARALRQASAWQRAGLSRQAASVYWTLLVAALLVLAPAIVALALPQHPAP